MWSLIYSYFVVPSTSYAFLFILSDVIWRFIVTIYEFKKKTKLKICNRKKDFINQLTMTFNFNNCTKCSFMILTILATYIVSSTNFLEILRDNDIITNMLNIIFVYIISRSCDWTYSIYNEFNTLKNNNGLDYASGMAHCYFYGYLKLLLPNRGDETLGLKERINIYESKEDVYFPVKKLFILIPDSLYLPSNFVEQSKFLSTAKSLKKVIRCRGGVLERVYKNAVYKLDTGNQPWYVCAEGATPLLTYYESIRKSGRKTRKDLISAIVEQFYKTLERLLKDDRTCCEEAELVYYQDLNQSGKLIDVGVILKEKIQYRLVNRFKNIND